jgi:hypothetical protein
VDPVDPDPDPEHWRRVCKEIIFFWGARQVRQLKLYSPANPWAEHRALEGQNDYIDLLGNDDIHPKQIMYHVPHYLRGVHQ